VRGKRDERAADEEADDLVRECFAAWREDPKYIAAYNALEDEFWVAKAVIEARAHAALTQEQLGLNRVSVATTFAEAGNRSKRER
jgi:hypothetical protein